MGRRIVYFILLFRNFDRNSMTKCRTGFAAAVNKSKCKIGHGWPILFLFCFLLLSEAGFTQEIDADWLLEQAELVLYPESFYSKVTMTTIKPGKDDKVMVIESYYKKDVGTFMEILAPDRSKGIRFLQKEETLWMFNPKSGSRDSIRLSPKDSFQGSTFSNNDVGDPEYSDDYNCTLADETVILEHTELGSVECYVLECVASHRDSTYGKVVMWVTKDGYIPLKMDYYAKSGLLFRQMELSGIKEIAGAVRPTIMKMVSLEEQDTFSIAVTEELEERNDLPDSMFTQSALTR
jgi:outer membrane lipoprotein-sorting protein